MDGLVHLALDVCLFFLTHVSTLRMRIIVIPIIMIMINFISTSMLEVLGWVWECPTVCAYTLVSWCGTEYHTVQQAWQIQYYYTFLRTFLDRICTYIFSLLRTFQQGTTDNILKLI